MIPTRAPKSPKSKYDSKNRVYTKYFKVTDGEKLIKEIISFSIKNNLKYKK